MSDKQKSCYILLILFLIATTCLINPTLAETGGLNVAITPKISEVPIGSSYTLNLTFISTQDFDDTISITVTTDGLPESWKADLSWFDWTFREEQITAGETLEFPFPVTIPGDAGPGYKAFRVVATSAHTGQEAYDTGILSLVALPQPTPTPTPTPTPPAEPVLWVGPLEIEVCLNPNETITTTFQVANVGNVSLENVSIVEPDVLWLDVVSGTTLGDMAPGEDQTIEVQFNSYDEGVGNHYGTLEVVSDNHPAVEVNVHADITTMPNGTVIFHVQDAYGLPIAGADITLMNQETYDTRINVTDERGQALFVSVPKGDYVYYVYSPNPEHYPGLGTIYVPPTEGCVGSQDVNVTLYVSYVDFEWSVTPTTIQDKYFITLNLTFETDIPVPVLVAVPPRIDDIIEPCGEVNGTLKLMNLGLISLFNVTLSPVEMDNGLTIEFDTDRIAEIKAKSETEVNYTLRLDCSAPECQIFTGRVVARGDYIHFNPFYTAETLYTVDCGDTDISTAPTDVAYNATPGYGYLNGEPSTAWGEEPYQSVRENDTAVRYRFDLEPDKVYQIELTFYDPTSSRNVSVYADGELLKANVELSDTPETITRKIEPQSIYSDGYVIVEIRTNTGDSAVVSEIKVLELYKKQLLGVAGTSVPVRIHSNVCPVPPDFEIPTWNMTIHHLPGGYSRVTYSNAEPCYLPTLRWWGGGGFTGKPIGWSWSIGPYTPPSSHPYHYNPPSYYYNPPSPHRHVPMPVPVEPLPPAEIKEVTVHEIVKLSISQTATMELEALFAGLKMTNRMWDRSIETIDIDINITDEQGNANDRFFIDVLRLSKINDVDGSGVLGALQTGIISWIFIPKEGAGGTDPDGKNYNVSADIRYTVSGQPILHRTKPVQVVVMPSAQLTLDYYIPSEVKAYKPFKLAVKASNSGFGPAKSFEIETAQPVIYYNPSGLLIYFEIIGSALNGVPRSNSLKVDFGDIGPNESKIAWWEMVTTLDGEFTEFTGKYTHSNEFGGTETSRIKDLRTYIIRRQVDTEAAFYDFLVDSDKDYVPDRVVDSSTGEAIDVLTVSYDVVFEPTVADPVLTVNVTKIEDKWIYIPVEDPYNNEASVVAVTRRSDGKVIPAQNYWQQEGKIYVVDDPDVTYDIAFNVSTLTAPVLGFVAPTPDNGSVITSNYVQINVSSDKPLTKVVLAWNGVNETMQGAGYHWYLNKTALSVGEYTFRATGWDSSNLSNETETRTVFIENQIPTASFVYYPEKPVREQDISFNASSSYDANGSIVEYSWEFGDETNATGVVVNHTYEWSGSMDMTYNVTLTVTDDFGLTNATTVSVFIAAPPVIVSYSPSSPINDTEGAARTFYVTVSKAVHVTWLINGTEVQTNTSVSEATYTNTSASVGVWNVSAIAADDNGTAVQSWVWNVTQIFVPNLYTRTIYIRENSGNDLTDYQVLISLSGSDFPVEANYTGADIRFADESGNVLNYWIEKYNYHAKNARIWVRVPYIPASSNTTIYMHYGNESARSASDIDATMDKGLRYFYYNGMGFDTYKGTDVDTNINHNWDTGRVSIKANPWEDQYETVSIQWKGWVKPKGSGTHRFYVTTDDGSRLYVNNSLIINKWYPQPPTEHSGTYSFSSIVPITYNWYERYTHAVAKLGWMPADGSGKTYPIPSFHLRNRKYTSPEPTITIGPLAALYVDLTLSQEDISFSNPTPTAGETVIINATIHNIGNATATNVAVQFFDDEMHIGSDQTIRSINASGTGTAQVNWTATSGIHNISVIVDPYDKIAESNETNNSAFTSIAIGEFTVVQAGNSWIIEPVIGDKSIASFYDYRSASSHTGFEEPYVSKIYLYRSNISGELGLIIHHHEDEKYGSGTVKMDFQNVPDGERVVVADDYPTEFSLSQEPEGNWAYGENTDGGAITLPKDTIWSISILPNFIKGVNAWRLVNGDGAEIELNRGEAVVISYSVPAPASWQYNRTIHIEENSGKDLTDYQVLINLSGYDFPVEANESGADIRFVDANENVLNYWIEEYHYAAKKARIWVKVPEVPANGTIALQMLWGNPGAGAMSDGDAAFEFFDDFNDSTLNTSKWTEIVQRNQGHYSLVRENDITYLKVWDDAQHCGRCDAYLYSRAINLDKAVMEWNVKVLQVRSGNPSFGIFGDGGTITYLNSCSDYDWWNIMLLGSWNMNLGHRTSYINNWGKVVMKFEDDHAYVKLVPENFELRKTESFPIDSFRIYITGGSCCYGGSYAGQHIFGYDYVFVRKYTSPEPITLAPVAAPADLTLTSSDIVFSNPAPTVGEIITINVTIHNIGNATATNVTVQFFDNETQIGSNQTITTINASEAGTAQVNWTATSGSHNISVIVDPYDEIAESNETNNSAYKSITVSDGTGWQYNRTIYIKENSDSDLTDYQVFINLSGDNFTAEANESGADIRFVDENENVLNHWIEEYNYSAKKARIWVKVPEIPANETVDLQMLWGNPGAGAMSSFDDTMEKLRVDNSTVALWHFDEGEGAIAYDASSNGNNGTIYGATWQSEDGGQWDGRSDVKFSNGSTMELDGVDDYVEVADSDSLDIETQSTFEVWLKLNEFDYAGVILNKWVHGAEDKSLIITDSGYVCYYLYDIFERKVHCSNTAITALGQWHHIAATYDGAYAKIYINSVLDNSRLASGDVSDSTGNLHIGYIHRDGVGCKSINGTVDEVAIYNCALGAEEIKAHYERRKYTSSEPTVTIGPGWLGF